MNSSHDGMHGEEEDDNDDIFLTQEPSSTHSNSQQSSVYEEIVSQNKLGVRQNRRTFLVTYSQADEQLCPASEDFAAMVVEAFTANDEPYPLYWACGREAHQDGGTHYHMALKFEKERKWKSAWNFLVEKYRVHTHFAAEAKMYIGAYRYVTKADPEPLHSENHPKLERYLCINELRITTLFACM